MRIIPGSPFRLWLPAIAVLLAGVGALLTSSAIHASPTAPVTRSTASDGAAYDLFGSALALSGDTLVVGAFNATIGDNNAQGAAYVYERDSGSAWKQVAKLVAPDGAADDWFGAVVALSDTTIVIGAPWADVGGQSDQGAAYMFERNQGGDGNWGWVKKLIAADGAADDWFGSALAISSDTLAAGAYFADIADQGDQGAVYIFERDQGGTNDWGQARKLVAADGAADDWFGAALSIGGDILAAGAPSTNSFQGATYIFSRNLGGAGNWGQMIKLSASDGAEGDGFGNAVALDGDTLVAGAPFAEIGSNGDQGAAYIFERNLGGENAWGEVIKLAGSDSEADEWFGASVTIAGEVLAIGAPYADPGDNLDQGAAYTFQRNLGGTNVWGQMAKLAAWDGTAEDRFGTSLSVDSGTLAAGAPYADVGKNPDQGAAYIYQIANSIYLPLVVK